MHIFFSVGEPSGDQHAAHLIRELRRECPDVQVSGFGGVLMEQAGCRVLYRLTKLAVMGLLPILPLLWRFYTLVRQAQRFFRDERPDAVVLVDFPGFNWWIARKAKSAGIPVFYYLAPQLWAWGPWRIKRMRRFVDRVMCALPFEEDWYAARGVHALDVGHPFFDDVAARHLDDQFCEEWAGRTVAILPGSRNQEIHQNWPTMLQVMQELHSRHPDLHFMVANFSEAHRQRCRQLLLAKAPNLPASFYVGKTPEIIQVADCCLAVSGSVSLELLARTTPTVIIYRLSRLVHLLSKVMMTCRYISLPNLIADRIVMPEFWFSGDPAPVVAQATEILHHWLDNADARGQAVAELQALHKDFVQPGATARAARAIVDDLNPRRVRQAA